MNQAEQLNSKIDMNLILSTLELLKNSKLKRHLFDLTSRINRITMKTYSSNMGGNDETIMEYINDIEDYAHLILENIDDWIRNYNSQLRMTMKKELAGGLIQIKQMLKNIIE